MMDKKTLLALAIIVTTLIAFWLTVWMAHDRLGLIRATKDLAIPEWLKLWIWGWR